MLRQPDGVDKYDIADWIELNLLYFRSSKVLYSSKLKRILDEGSPDGYDEESFAGVITELQRREYLYGTPAPFKVDGERFISNFGWKKYPEHTLSLIYSTYGGMDRKLNGVDGREYFELISASLLGKEFGSKYIILGTSKKVSFSTKVSEVAKYQKLKVINEPERSVKDDGIDFIICKRFDNVLNNGIMFFFQCATGKYFDNKKRVSSKRMRKYLDLSNEEIVDGLVITKIRENEHWNNNGSDFGLVIDRCRLYRLLIKAKRAMSDTKSLKLQKWCEEKLSLYEIH